MFETGSHVDNIYLTTQIKMLDVSLGRDNWLDTSRRHPFPPCRHNQKSAFLKAARPPLPGKVPILQHHPASSSHIRWRNEWGIQQTFRTKYLWRVVNSSDPLLDHKLMVWLHEPWLARSENSQDHVELANPLPICSSTHCLAVL